MSISQSIFPKLMTLREHSDGASSMITEILDNFETKGKLDVAASGLKKLAMLIYQDNDLIHTIVNDVKIVRLQQNQH